MNFLPKSRTNDIVMQPAGTELLIYDLLINKAFVLNETSALIYQACDGKTRFDELKFQHKLTDDLIYLALDELKRENLIIGKYQSKFNGLTCREVIRTVGLTSMIALPVISSLIAPTSATPNQPI